MELNKDTLRKLCGLIVFTIVVFLGIYRFNVVLSLLKGILHVLLPFILGGIIAFILSLPMGFFQRTLFAQALKNASGKMANRIKKLSSVISLILSILLVAFIVFLVIAVVLPQLTDTVSQLAKTLPGMAPVLLDKLELFFADYPDIIKQIEGIEIDWNNFFVAIMDFFRSGALNVLGSTWSVAKNIFGAFTTFFIGFVFSCYILLQKETLSKQFKKLIFAYLPEKASDKILSVLSLSHSIFSSFIAGQCLEAVILGTMFFIVMTILGFPYALLIGVLIAFTALIPIFGAFIGCGVGAFLILTISPMQALAFIIIFLVLQQIEGNFIYPHVVGGSIGLPSIWVLAAVSVGGSLFGIIGILVFIPLVSVIYTLIRENVDKRLREKNIDIA